MIASWMLYCSVCALGLSVAAALAERALLSGRGPVRLVWIGAVALSLLVPVAAFRFAPRPEAAELAANVSDDAGPGQRAENAFTISAPMTAPPPSPSPRRDWRATLKRFDEPLAIAWATLSLAAAFRFFGGIVTLAWMRRGWRRRIVLDVPVFVSERTGPAVVGAMSPAIVLPEWVLALEPPQLALLLRHEQEHRHAGDGRLLAAAHLALIAMPWNVALWWQVLRLRVAVELDCDARVLQDADARSYGDLLLEAARPRRGISLAGATAFAERASQLERRIRVLGRHRVRTSHTARALATGIGVAAMTVAWVAPRPPAPARTPAAPAVPVLARMPVELAAPAPPLVPSAPASAASRQTDTPRPIEVAVAPKMPRMPVPDNATRVEPAATVVVATNRDSTGGRSGGVQGDQPRDPVFDRLFAGITLTADQEARARALLTRLQQQQLVQDEAARVVTQVRLLALRAQRDAALRALVTNDADLATLDARLAQPAGGGGGRSGGAPPDSLTGGRRGRVGGAGGGVPSIAFDSLVFRGRGAPGAPPAGQDVANLEARLGAVMEARLGAVMIATTFHRLFDGIMLTTDQDSTARYLIARTWEESRVQLTRPEVHLRMNWVTGLVTMQAQSAADLIALVSNDADRATLQSRVVVVPR